METNYKFKDEIVPCLMSIEKEGAVTWNDFITSLESFIISVYAGEDIGVYRGFWKTAFTDVAKRLGFKILNSKETKWSQIGTQLKLKQQEIEKLPTSNSSLSSKSDKSQSSSKKSKSKSDNSSESSSNKNNPLSVVKIKEIKVAYDSMDESKKWKLSTGTCVEDVMKKLAIECKYEHPVHSMILDTSDIIWIDHFTEEELEEINNHNRRKLPDFPNSYQQYLDNYDNDLTAKEIYQKSCSSIFDPVVQHTEKWMQQTLMMAANLFLHNKKLKIDDYSEADILNKIWPFIYHLFDDNVIEAKLGEQSSVAVTKNKNKKRKLETIDKRERKLMGSRMDILFKDGFMEVGCAEVGKEQLITTDDKYMNDSMIKLPKSLRDMLSSLAGMNKDQVNHIVVIGYIIMGLNIELVMMDAPVGSYVSRILRSPRYTFPTNINTFATDMIPILQITWAGKQLMIDTINVMNKRKRTAVNFSSIKSLNPVLQPSFNAY
ncbi:unnamed protein product [Cunninghamella echinulata]